MKALRKLAALGLVFGVLAGSGAANAAASEFTASETGELAGWGVITQTLTTSGGEIRCSNSKVSGELPSTASDELHATVEHSGCTAFGISDVHMSPATYLFTAFGTVHLENTVTIEVTVPFFPDCTITIKPQTLAWAYYSNWQTSVNAEIDASLIEYTSTGGFCGESGSNGIIEEVLELWRNGGGTLSYDE